MVLPGVCSCFFFWWVHNHGTISPHKQGIWGHYIYQWFFLWVWVEPHQVPNQKGDAWGELQSEFFHLCFPLCSQISNDQTGRLTFFFWRSSCEGVFCPALDVGNSKIPLASYALGSYREGRCCIDSWAAPLQVASAMCLQTANPQKWHSNV